MIRRQWAQDGQRFVKVAVFDQSARAVDQGIGRQVRTIRSRGSDGAEQDDDDGKCKYRCGA